MAAPIAAVPRSGAVTSFRVPSKVPIAVRTGSAITIERSEVMVVVRQEAPAELRSNERTGAHIVCTYVKRANASESWRRTSARTADDAGVAVRKRGHALVPRC